MNWLIAVDHGYEGERQVSFAGTEAEAKTKAAELASDPYVMRVWVEEEPGQ